MRLFIAILLSAALLGLAGVAGAQPPGGGKKDGPGRDRPAAGDTKSFVDRMMAFDKNKDGKLTRDEITDERLLRLFDRADANKDGVVTREELEALAAREMQDGGGRVPGGPGGPGGRFGGPGGFGGPPPVGQVLPPFVRDMLEVTDDQKKQLDELQKEVDAKLAKILTDDQRKRLREMRDRGPGGRFGGPPKKD
jgi:hypothetical protein